MNQRFFHVCWLLIASVCAAQTIGSAASAPPVSYSSISELNQLLAGLQQTSLQIQGDLSHLRVQKWKTDSKTKNQTESDIESVQRNLQTALPGILNDLKNSPESAPVTFKLYRNLDALYDVLTSIVESAGAFGNKDEFRSIDGDLGSLEQSRHAFADRMEKIASAKETEIGQLRTALQTARSEIPPKKVVVDDTQPAPPQKTTTHKKTSTKPKSKPKPSPSQPNAPSNGQTSPQ
ncbi:MAG TPA: hypothetical protein VH596_17970 [Terriglobales bacterium]|jgi:hypothetical protein